MPSEPSEINVSYELLVLRGPDAPEDGQVRGGVVGRIVEDIRSAKRVITALTLALVTGAGGTVAWVYAAGEDAGKERTEMREMRRDLDECLCRTRGGNWLPPGACVTSDP
jgi:hypothetical protein